MVHRKEREIQFELSQRTNVINFFIITSSVKRGLLISDLTVIKTGGATSATNWFTAHLKFVWPERIIGETFRVNSFKVHSLSRHELTKLLEFGRDFMPE